MNNKSFTLIELIVVIAVIGFISSIILVSMKGTRGKARITTGLQFSQSINYALGAYAVGIWDFNEGSGVTAHDRSGYANHGTIHGATYVGGPAGGEDATPYHILGQGEGKYVLSFDGNDYVDCGDDLSLNVTDAITIEAWIYYNGDGVIFSNDGWYMFGNGYYLSWFDPEIVARLNNGSPQPILRNSAPSKNAWHHIVFTWDIDSKIEKMYINGIQARNTVIFNGPIGVSSYNLNIGKDPRFDWHFKGAIDEVRIYERALSAAQIQQRYVESAPRHGIVLK